jgi:succinate dehydrogenase / fumarate reductase cytochrome b subunit
MSTVATFSARSARSTGTFMRARLGSLLAVAPLGIWTVGHLWNNLAAFQGDEAWTHAVTDYPHPLAQLATAVVVLLPLVLHAAWGVGRLFSMRVNNVRYGYWANLKYLLQRLSAVGLFFFLCAHLWLAMLKPRLQTGHAEPFADISHEMHFHMPTLAVYILGTLGLAYHLANGLHSFAMGWGVVTSKRALRQTEWVIMGAFVALLAMGWGVIYALYSAAT